MIEIDDEDDDSMDALISEITILSECECENIVRVCLCVWVCV